MVGEEEQATSSDDDEDEELEVGGGPGPSPAHPVSPRAAPRTPVRRCTYFLHGGYEPMASIFLLPRPPRPKSPTVPPPVEETSDAAHAATDVAMVRATHKALELIAGGRCPAQQRMRRSPRFGWGGARTDRPASEYDISGWTGSTRCRCTR